MALSKNNSERLRMLNGCECQSLTYEGCVYIERDKVYMDGEVVDILNTNSKVNNLWEEYLEGEGF